jgi:transcriptional regulator with XRE-family HTH domain
METLTKSDIKEKLKDYRRLKNFSQENLAETSGISIRTIQRIEKGESIGSAYTLNKLATALGIDVLQLTDHPVGDPYFPDDREKLNILNLSVLSVILIPLCNIILPLFILLRNRDNRELHQWGRRIVNFQLLWTLSTIMLMIFVPLLLMSLRTFQGSGIPLAIPVYYLSVIVNVYFTLKISICINNRQSFLNRVPAIW